MVFLFLLGSLIGSIYLSRNEKFLDGMTNIVHPIVMAIRRRLRRKFEDPYSELNPRYSRGFIINRRFTGRTEEKFKIQYELKLMCRRLNEEEFKRHRMMEESSRQELAAAFHDEIFEPHFKESSYIFYFDFHPLRKSPSPHELVTGLVGKLVLENQDVFLRYVPDTKIRYDLGKIPFQKNGCEVTGYFESCPFTDELIEENYAMLTDEQKTAVEADERYDAITEAIAVAALKKRLEFLGKSTKQRHETDELSVETEKAGRGVLIKWRFKTSAPSGSELFGFRRQGGFFNDATNENNNGTLILHSDRDGEVVDFLNEGEAGFYTLLLKWAMPEPGAFGTSVVRLQIVVAPKEEMEAIESTLQRSQRPPDDREHISRARKEIDSYVELEEAIDEVQKNAIERIKAANYSQIEKEEKISRLEEVIGQVRDKHQFL